MRMIYMEESSSYLHIADKHNFSKEEMQTLKKLEIEIECDLFEEPDKAFKDAKR